MDSESHAPEPETQQPAEPKKPMPEWMKRFIVIGCIVVAFIVQDWWLVARGNGARQRTFENAVKAMAVALQPTLLTRNTDRARPVITSMATAGNFALIVVTDPSGRVIASTDRSQDAITIDDMKNPIPGNTQIRSVDGGLQATTPIALGGNNVIGTLRVVLPPGE